MNRKTSIIILVCLTLGLVGCGQQAIMGATDDELVKYIMNHYDAEEDKVTLSEAGQAVLLQKDRSDVAYYKDDSMEVLLYTENTGTSYVMINGQKYSFDEGNAYYTRPYEMTNICIYDINGDDVPDISITDGLERMGMIQNAYMSTENGKYQELGPVTWNRENSYEEFPFQFSLLDDYQVLIELEEYDIKETVYIAEDYKKVAEELGIYDENGKLTDYGTQFFADEMRTQTLIESNISYDVTDNKQLLIRVDTLIWAGYSNYDLGSGFTFEWTVSETGYQLRDVKLFQENIS